ncbi:hypothetical protein HK105_206206 [Polyrhizophydium stewartii]|uniref:ER-bound oxygenase mpaB/mpaB'/Rubber oxygenase catalytic domain-containing protein n=1 Tax=Polyrhizophydium stewartii TaxID=2732419 RepID=A0ABR4N400_9FUNG
MGNQQSTASTGQTTRVAGALVVAYLIAVARVRFASYHAAAKATIPPLQDIDALGKVYNHNAFREFPFLNQLALQFGFFKTYGIPSISKLLVATGEIPSHCTRRLVDTELLIREATERPLSTERAQTALRRLNFLHGHYPIKNSDYLYVLAVFMVEPVLWSNRYGYRKMHPNEVQVHFLYWTAIGIRMGIKDIPATFDDAVKFMEDYEVQHMRFSESNAKIAESTINAFLQQVPGPLHGFVRQSVYALTPERLRIAMGFPKPIYGLRTFLEGILSLHGFFVRYFMFPRNKLLLGTLETPNADGKLRLAFHVYDKVTYKDGYTVDTLGPAKFEKDNTLGPLYEQGPDSIAAPTVSHTAGTTA